MSMGIFRFIRFLYHRWLRRELHKVIERDLADSLPPGKAIHELPMHDVRRMLQAGGRNSKLS